MKLGTATVTAIYLGTTSIVSAYLGATQVFGGSFTPLDLFSGGAQGVWLDPSDLSTMFSDRAGTTPVTTPGTVVGLRLDKSKGLVLGAELVANGDFSSATGWTVGAGWTISGGVATRVADTVASGVSRSISPTAGVSYQVTYTITSYTSGNFLVRFTGGTTVNGTTRVGTGTFTEIIVAATGNNTVDCRMASGSGALVIDNISVRELPGNHAVAPTDAARPVYGVEPKGGRRNLLTWSEDFRNTAAAGETRPWTIVTATVAGGVTDPLGGSSAYTLTATTGMGYIRQALTAVAGNYVNSIWIRRRTGTGNINLWTPGQTTTTISVTSDWQRFSVAGAVTTTLTLLLQVAITGDAIDIWGAQLETGSTATAYQRVTTAYDVTESGVATCHYVQFDGSDDSMSTAAIDFTATDKMSVFVGVRKLSDAATATFLESSVNSSTSAGAFLVRAPASAAANYSFGSSGTALSSAVAATSYAAPISNVITGLGDISGDTATLRINGTQAAQATTDQGTGNYGNYPIYIGRRAGAFQPFNGRDYGLIVVGKAASAGEITDTETWLAAKTAQVTL